MNEPKLMLRVVGDTNDADYISQETEITMQEWEKVKPIFEDIMRKRWEKTWTYNYSGETRGDNHNWARDEFDRRTLDDIYGEEWVKENYNKIGDYIPYGEFGVHSITDIELREVKYIFNWTEFKRPEEC